MAQGEQYTEEVNVFLKPLFITVERSHTKACDLQNIKVKYTVS